MKDRLGIHIFQKDIVAYEAQTGARRTRLRIGEILCWNDENKKFKIKALENGVRGIHRPPNEIIVIKTVQKDSTALIQLGKKYQ